MDEMRAAVFAVCIAFYIVRSEHLLRIIVDSTVRAHHGSLARGHENTNQTQTQKHPAVYHMYVIVISCHRYYMLLWHTFFFLPRHTFEVQQ